MWVTQAGLSLVFVRNVVFSPSIFTTTRFIQDVLINSPRCEILSDMFSFVTGDFYRSIAISLTLIYVCLKLLITALSEQTAAGLHVHGI